MNSMPTFLIIGAQKAGTTALHYYLSQHPQIFMSPIKEPGFFAFEGGVPDFQGPGDAEGYRLVTTKLEDYQKLFEDATNETAIGESSTWYLNNPQAPERIKKYLPNAKLIAILRNPIDRAYSSYQHLVRDGRETESSFEQALNEEKRRSEANWEYLWRYTDVGLYATHLEGYFNLFDPQQIKVYLYEDLDQFPEKLLKETYQFLEVDEVSFPGVLTRLNVSGKRKNKLLDDILYKGSLPKKILKPFLPNRFRKELANYIRTKNIIKDSCPPEVRKKLIDFFYEDIARLQDMIQRDLSHWLKIE